MEEVRKKVAFCFSGQARRFDLCHPYIKKFLFDPLGKNGKDYDIFCCVEDDEDCTKILKMNPTKIMKVKTENLEEGHKEIISQNYRKYVIRQDLNRQLNQLNKILLSNNLRKKYEKKNNISYDWIIRIRFDTFPINKINYSLLDNQALYLPRTAEKRFPSYNDMFAIGNGRLMDIYSNRLKSFDKMVETFYSDNLKLPYKISFFLEGIYVKIFQGIINISKKDSRLSRLCRKMIIAKSIFFLNVPYENYYNLERALFRYLKYKKVKVRELTMDYVLIRSSWGANGVFLSNQ